MEGVLERTIRETRENGALHGILRVVGVVTDDLERDMEGSPYPVRPEPGKAWIHPMDLLTESEELVADKDFTHWLPSRFRALPSTDIDGRAREKEFFEREVLAIMRQRGADVIVSDHYMACIAYMINEKYGQFGRVLNIHPAITRPGHPCRFLGKSPTKDAIDQARTGKPTFTGATLHLVDAEIDHGPILADVAETEVLPEDVPQELRYRNYQQGKLPLFTAGMQHYVRHVYPHLGEIDLSALKPIDYVPADASH
jgi:folate-dependent phosphoribosylglycinamide formyltransferase PurN